MTDTSYPRLIVSGKQYFHTYISEFVARYDLPEISKNIISPDGAAYKLQQIRAVIGQQSTIDKQRLYIFEDFQSATSLVQNAMLKLLEENSRKHFFFLHATTIESILPTVISRCLIIQTQDEKDTILLGQKEKELLKNIFSSILSVQRQTYLPITMNSKAEAEDFFHKVILYGKSLLHKSPEARLTKALTSAMRIFGLLRKNNLNPQLAVDAWLIENLR